MPFRNRLGRLLALLLYLVLGSGLVACQASPPVIPTLAASPTPTLPPAPPAGVLWVDPSQDLGAISPFVLGANHGPWSNLSVEDVEPANTSGITFLRWPGGNWGDRNDVQTYYIDTYIAQARQMGAEPSITVRLPGSTPEQAAAEVRYVNIEKKYGVKYWAIGNEASLYESDVNMQALGLDAAKCAQLWREFAVAMKAVDPTIILYGPDTHQFKGDPSFDPKDKAGRDYLREFLKLNGDMVDIVAVHRYPFTPCVTCPPTTPDMLLANTPEWDNIIPNLRREVKEITGKDLPVGVMEYNSDTSSAVGAQASPDSFANAIWLADVLGRMIRHRPEMLAYWLLKSGSDAGHGLMDSYTVRPPYYVFQIYKRFGNHLLAANSDEALVSVFAAKKDDGQVTVILVNRGEAVVTRPFKLEKGDALKLAEVYLFDKDHPAQAVTPPAFKNGDPVELAGRSVTLFIFKP